MSIDFADLNLRLNGIYQDIFYISSFCLAVFTAFVLSFATKKVGRVGAGIRNVTPNSTYILSISLVAFFGLATLFGVYISDTYWYEWGYRHMNEYTPFYPSTYNDALFINIQVLFHRFGLNDYFYFALFVAIVYIGTILYVCYRLMRNNMWIAMLFFVTSFSFFSYGANGIRNGAACHCVILGISYLSENEKKRWLLSIPLFIIANYLHSSTILPIVCAIVARICRLKPHLTINIWLLSIVVSLLFGNTVANIFVGIGFDERFDSTFAKQQDEELMEAFSSSGFRMDFLLYSAAPVLMIWYLVKKRNFQDETYNLIANTYLLANSFWIMVIRAAFSNRFAYLSWFIYPLVFAYPLVRFNIWKNQDKKAALILLLYAGFTFIMQYVYYK